MASKLTKRQQLVLDSIERCLQKNGYGPTVREICADLGLCSPSTVHVHLKTLEEKGYIARDPLKSRSITLAGRSGKTTGLAALKSRALKNTVSLPLLGAVAAGNPILAEENVLDVLTLPMEIVGDSPTFLLTVRGDSMIGAGIHDGDYVAVKQQPVAENGDIVVAVIDDEATVKRFYREEDSIRLEPENPAYSPILLKDCTLAGKVVAVFRRL